MGAYYIAGQKPLKGECSVGGAKNAVLPMLAAAVLNPGVVTIHNCPRISDVFLSVQILESLGAKVNFTGNTLCVNAKDITNNQIGPEFAGKMRSSILFLGALLGRTGQAGVSHPGGCNLGVRPIDYHIKGLSALGALVKEGKMVEAEATELLGRVITLDSPSVGATENIMLAAVLAKGQTVIVNGAREPEITDLQGFLNQMGADVSGAGTNEIVINGVKSLHDCEYSVMPDRIVAGTLLVAGMVTGGNIHIKGASGDDMKALIEKLREMGGHIKEWPDAVSIRAPKQLKCLKIVNTQPYPGFPTDMQPQITTALTIAKGTSVVQETVFDSRNKFIPELMRMGADIRVMNDGRTFVIDGVKSLSGATIEAAELRGGAALMLAALSAQGESRLIDPEGFIDRGYENLAQMFNELGATIIKE